MQQFFSGFNLPSLSLPVKALFTGYILVAGFGLIMAGAQLLLTHGMADGKLGLSVDDIVYSYHGNRQNSTLESKLNGSMQPMATEEQRMTMIEWVRAGSPESQWIPAIKPIVDAQCAACHASMPGLSSLATYAEMKKRTEIDSGVSVEGLTRSSHIHLFAIAFVFFFIGLIFSLAVGINRWLKALLIFMPFALLIVEVAGWWLTKMNPAFAPLIMFSGVGYNLAAATMMLIALFQMWVLPLNGQSYDDNSWQKQGE